MPAYLPCTSSVQTTIEIKEPFYGAYQIAIAYLGAAEVENYGTKKKHCVPLNGRRSCLGRKSLKKKKKERKKA